MIVVADAGPLIAFAQLGELEILHRMFAAVLVPSEVAREVFEARPRVCPDWIRVERPTIPAPAVLAEIRLDDGERAAIRLALERRADLVLIDDRMARRAAAIVGLSIAGTVGVLLLGKRQGLLESVRPRLDALMATGFRLADDLYANALAAANELPSE